MPVLVVCFNIKTRFLATCRVLDLCLFKFLPSLIGSLYNSVHFKTDCYYFITLQPVIVCLLFVFLLQVSLLETWPRLTALTVVSLLLWSASVTTSSQPRLSAKFYSVICVGLFYNFIFSMILPLPQSIYKDYKLNKVFGILCALAHLQNNM